MRDAAGHPFIMVALCFLFMLAAFVFMSWLDGLGLVSELGNGQ